MNASQRAWVRIGLPALAALALLLGAAGWVAGLFTAGDRGRGAVPRGGLEGPRLQAAPARDLARLRTRERAELNRYAWVDRGAGVAQIPIERAMRLLLARDPQRIFADPVESAGSPGEKPSAEALQRATAQARAAADVDVDGRVAPAASGPTPDERPVAGDQQHPSLGGPTPPPGERSP